VEHDLTYWLTLLAALITIFGAPFAIVNAMTQPNGWARRSWRGLKDRLPVTRRRAAQLEDAVRAVARDMDRLQHRVVTPIPALDTLRQQAEHSPPTPSDAPRGR
jgi:hypothetical protein